MADSFTLRTPAGGGAVEKILTHVVDDLTQDATSNANRRQAEVFAWRGHPAQLVRVTPLVGVTTAGAYPLDGDGVADAASSTTLTLDAAGATAEDVTGLLLVMLTGAAGVQGAVKRILDYNTSTRVATVSTWATTPAAGNTYALLLECSGRSQLIVKAEFEDATTTAQLYPVFYDVPREPTDTGGDAGLQGLDTIKRAPRQFLGRRFDLFPVAGFTMGVEQSGYFHAPVLSEDCRGALGAKLRLHTVPAGGKKISLWAATA